MSYLYNYKILASNFSVLNFGGRLAAWAVCSESIACYARNTVWYTDALYQQSFGHLRARGVVLVLDFEPRRLLCGRIYKTRAK